MLTVISIFSVLFGSGFGAGFSYRAYISKKRRDKYLARRHAW
jgi:uncharacterized membrane protein YeiB